MSSSFVEVSEQDAIATLTLNRPDRRNALSIEMCDAIVAALEEIEGRAARVVIVGGAGTTFCAGADFSAVGGSEALEFIPAFERMLDAVIRHPLPTIARIHGAALGGGLQLASACDFRIAATGAPIGIPSARLGIVVNFENVQRLVLLAGAAIAREVLMTGRLYNGEEAAAAGLVHRAVSDDRLDAEVAAFAAEMSALSPLAVRGVKQAIQVVMDHLGAARANAPDDAARMDALVEEAYRSADLAEGLKARTEKRAPNFEGR